MAYFIVGENNGMTETTRRLAITATHDQAAKYIGSLPGHEGGEYYIDGPITGVVALTDNKENK